MTRAFATEDAAAISLSVNDQLLRTDERACLARERSHWRRFTTRDNASTDIHGRTSLAFEPLSRQTYGHCKGVRDNILWNVHRSAPVSEKKSEVLQGTLDLMVLKTLYAMGPQHGFGIARRIEQVSDGVLDLNEGTVYTALLRLQQQGWIASKWGASENNRRARFYSITRLGTKQLERETKNWERVAGVMDRVLRLERQG
jgi:PadR family transcriptional regulator, regulatory protein PadR